MASGGEFPGGKEGISPKNRGLMAHGNLRNASNSGPAYVNCRNSLRNANWNYLG